MERVEHQEIVIIGGGISGLAIALALHRKSIKSLVLERFETLRSNGAGLIMMTNGWKALHHLGIADELRKSTIRTNSGHRIINGKKVKLHLGNDEVRCLKREDLIRVLYESLPEGTVRFGCRVVSVKINVLSESIMNLDDGRSIRAKLIIGCDGVHSTLCDELGLPPMKVTSTSVIRGFTEYANGHSLPQEFQIHTSNKGQFGSIPISENSVYWFITRIKNPDDTFIVGNKQRILESGLGFVKEYDERDIKMVKKTDKSILCLTPNLILRSPFDLLTCKFRKGTVTVAGDALHAMGPFQAQGGSLSLEDAVILVQCVGPCIEVGPEGRVVGKGIETALDDYLKKRKMRLFWIMSHTYLIGVLVSSIPSRVLKFIATFLLVVLFGRDPAAHVRYDCGPL